MAGLQSCARVTIGPWRWNSYFTCGCVGYLVGLALSMSLALRAGLGAPARLAIAIVPPASLLLAIRVVLRAIGRERIVFYEKALTAVALGTIAAAVAGAPARVALDVVMLGVGAFLACGRIGCFRVGCCYGRAWRHGVRYGRAHVRAGFPAHLEDVPLAPIQLLDGGLAAALTAIGTVLVVRGSAPGHAAALWIAGYALGRFALELARGDERPTALGLSEAQWIALATSWLALVLWPIAMIAAIAIALIVAGAALALARGRRWPATYWLASPRHVRELEAAIASRASVVTSERMRVSVHRLADGALDVVASREDATLASSTARRLAEKLDRRWRLLDVIDGRTPGLVHVLLRDQRR